MYQGEKLPELGQKRGKEGLSPLAADGIRREKSKAITQIDTKTVSAEVYRE